MRAKDEAARASWGARVFWILVHVGVYLVLLFYPSELRLKLLVQKNYVYFILYNLCLLSCTLMYFTVGNNPGYISPYSCETPRILSSGSDSNSSPSLENNHNTDSGDVILPLSEPKNVPLNFCDTCTFTQPLRTKHCDECGHCVARFDHHCFFIGSCVGQRNHLRFWVYLFVQTFFVGWNCSLLIPAYRTADSISGWFSLNALVFASSLIVFTVFFISFGLFVFHCYLAATNQTTWETVKRHKITYLKDLDHEILPFDRGVARNIKDFLSMHRAGYIWEMPTIQVQRGFNICINKYWSCF